MVGGGGGALTVISRWRNSTCVSNCHLAGSLLSPCAHVITCEKGNRNGVQSNDLASDGVYPVFHKDLIIDLPQIYPLHRSPFPR